MVQSTDPEAICTCCIHNKHKNENCFKQHPELRKKYMRRKGSAKVASSLNFDVSKEEDDDGHLSLGTIARAGASLKNCLLYDTGASHHFAGRRDNFVHIEKLTKPFEFDQAVGNSTLTHEGTCSNQQ